MESHLEKKTRGLATPEEFQKGQTGIYRLIPLGYHDASSHVQERG